jgi:phosphopantothenoylcysteine decarboxylase / phosphopantothenate---cysteine ligase
MDILKGKKVIVGITGGIAAYKSCFLVRNLVSRGAEVRVVITPSAAEFVTPLTLSALSQNKVIVNVFPSSQKDGADSGPWHIEYALWADIMIIAPATINTIAKIVNGFADNALTTLVCALRSPLVVAPAADVDMYNNPITRNNVAKLKSAGAFIVEAEEGFLASGLTGKGRMAEIEKILEAAELVLSGFKVDMEGRNILVTAGPTYEDIDPVRFIGNRSSGKMGIEIAKAAFLRGANVTLICGPTKEKGYQEVKTINVRSADDMKKAVDAGLNENDLLIMAAAVADFTPAHPAKTKIKKELKAAGVELALTADILSSINKEGKKVIGFALETDNELENAQSKLEKKNLDMIVLNSLKETGAGFECDTNKVTVIRKGGYKKELPLLSKFQTANYILSEIKNLF